VNTKPFWEQAYQDIHGATFSGGKASREFRKLAPLLSDGARVLDLGCGDGRNALFMAEHGCNVTAVDISAAGIAKVQYLAGEKGVSITTHVQDVREFRFKDNFDVIICHGCLHFIERPQWQRLLNDFKAHTTPGGFNVITVFTNALSPPDDLKELCVGLFKEGELYDYYADWETFHKESYVLKDQHPHSPPHQHPINKLVARKL